MILTNLIANFEDAFSYEGKPARAALDHLQYGTGATHRLYKTSGSDGSRWVLLAVDRDDEFARFCRMSGCDDLARDPDFATVAARRENRSELESVLEEVFRTRRAEDWEASSLAHGVGCVRADAISHFAFLYSDPQAKAIGMMSESEHASFGGVYWRHAPLLRFSRTPGEARPYCDLGEHTRTILHELGYDKDEMVRLKEDNVVDWLADETKVAATSGLNGPGNGDCSGV
jgi:crotonobetainyl-CoA:carnitine CoA-transferase CaiB-like acyl-CoA transferase